MKAQELHEKLSGLVKTERKITDLILQCILEMDQSRSFAELGYGSLFDYLVQAQKYSEGSAQRRISAARLMKEMPELKEKLASGSVNLTQLARIQVAIKQEQKITGEKVTTLQKQSIIEKIENKKTYETEKILVQELHLPPAPKEKIQLQKDESVFLSLKLSSEQYQKLKEVQFMLTHINHDPSLGEVFEILCDQYLKKKTGKPLATAAAAVRSRKYISIKNKREIFEKAELA